MKPRLAAVEARLSAEGETEVASSLMFHGTAHRPDAEYPLLEYGLGDRLEHPLWITRNAYRQPAIFRPMLNWIVDREVAGILREYPNIELLQVKIEKAFEEPYEAGEERFEEVDDEEELFESFADDPGLRRRLGDFFEVVVAPYSQLEKRVRPPAVRLEVETEMSSKPEVVELDRQLLEDFPMFSQHSLTFLAWPLYERISPFLDPRFFRCVELEAEI